jgi:hypothetical protein
MKNLKKFFVLAGALFSMASCALYGGSKSNENGVIKFITGAAKVDEVKDVHIVNMIRAIGVPKNSIVIGKYKYYQWEYSRAIGVSTILGGGSTTFYCNLSTETQNNKVQLLNWYGNQCDIFLDQINEYFKNKLNIAVISDEDIKQQVTTTITMQPVAGNTTNVGVGAANVIEKSVEKEKVKENIIEKNHEKNSEEKNLEQKIEQKREQENQ